MNDKDLMEGLLLTEKGVCDLYMHGTIESTPGNVRQAFAKALNESLCMQNTLYEQMSQKGWYPEKPVEQQKIDEVKQKFSAQG
mgnify:FL=1